MNKAIPFVTDQQHRETGEQKKLLSELLSTANITINGQAPWDMRIHDDQVYARILHQGSLGAGESYMDGLWEAEKLDDFFCRILKFNVSHKIYTFNKFRLLISIAKYRLLNQQTKSRAWQVGERHYDIGNDLFEVMLDPSMSYSCAYWQGAQTLAQAQQNKLDLICRKLQLQAGEKLLDIGCGWGGLAEYAAKHYQVEVTGVTISKEQCALAQQRCRNLPVEILLRDYRDLQGSYDKIVSVGMFEHVGTKNYPRFFNITRRLLKDKGLFLLHTIGEHTKLSFADPWIQKYIFPNGKIPSSRALRQALRKRFVIKDWHTFGNDYDRTLLAWWNNFQGGWPELQSKYGERFYRMWKYYLLSCAGYFRSQQGLLWQVVLSKPNYNIVYHSVR